MEGSHGRLRGCSGSPRFSDPGWWRRPGRLDAFLPRWAGVLEQEEEEEKWVMKEEKAGGEA